MATITKTMTKQQIDDLRRRIEPLAKSVKQPAYTYFQIKLTDVTITAYQSGKVIYQGKDLSFMENDEKPSVSSASSFPQAGSDEVGTGDYFGPVVVSACIVYEKDAAELKSLGIDDSKKMTDEKIRECAPIVKKLCPHTILVVSNEKYNQVHEHFNMNGIKAVLHNQAYLNLIRKGYELPALCVVDQFARPATYYAHLKNEKEVVRTLTFQTKAESAYLAVACASVLARSTFLEYFDKMEEKYDFHFEKGASGKVDACAARFVDKFGWQELGKVAKLHFKNTEKIRDH